jgi:hypothetical protein
MINWKGCGKKRSLPISRHYSVIRLEGPRKATKASVTIDRCPDRDSKETSLDTGQKHTSP